MGDLVSKGSVCCKLIGFRSDEGLKLETSVSEFFHGGKFNLLTSWLIVSGRNFSRYKLYNRGRDGVGHVSKQTVCCVRGKVKQITNMKLNLKGLRAI